MDIKANLFNTGHLGVEHFSLDPNNSSSHLIRSVYRKFLRVSKSHDYDVSNLKSLTPHSCMLSLVRGYFDAIVDQGLTKLAFFRI